MKIRKNKKWIAFLLVCISITAATFALAGCGSEQTDQDGTYQIQITGDEDNETAAELLALMNQYRSEQGLDPLGWNEEPAEMLRVRAAELAINFSETRLDGTPGEEMFRGNCDNIPEDAGKFLKDEGFVKLLQDPENTSFSAGVYRSYSGPLYVAAALYPETGVESVPSPVSKERTFVLTVRDDALNCRGQLMDQEMEPEDPNELYKGEGYYYCILNENPADQNTEELVGMDAASSDPDVVTIDAYGAVSAKGAGSATLTVRPAKASSIEFTQEVQVH